MHLKTILNLQYISTSLHRFLQIRSCCSNSLEKTFIMVKPDGLQRGLVGKIIQRFEAKGFQLIALKMMRASEELLRKHYENIKDKPFFESIVAYMMSGPVVPMVWQGKNVVNAGRRILGPTNPSECNPGTLRGDFAVDVARNVCHGSDSIDTAKREIKLWFDNDIIDWKPVSYKWLYEK